MSGRVAVIGAGVAGLTAARELASGGLSVQVFDKGRRPAGRISTRREGDFSFDHGAQYFTARGEEFRAQVEELAAAGVLAPWEATLVSLRGDGSEVRAVATDETRWVGVPTMSALAGALASTLDVRSSTRITALERTGERWELRDEDGTSRGEFEEVVLTPPPPQTAALLPDGSLLRRAVEELLPSPCLAVLLGLERRLEVPFDGSFVEDSPLAWIARNTSKPGRPDGESWVLHADPDWSEERFFEPPETWTEELVSALEHLARTELPPRAHQQGFRWRFARSAPERVPRGFLRDANLGLTVCGDGCAGLRVEGAWTSGLLAARELLAERS